MRKTKALVRKQIQVTKACFFVGRTPCREVVFVMKETKRLSRRFLNIVMSLFLMCGLLGTAGNSAKADTKNIDEESYFAINSKFAISLVEQFLLLKIAII